MTDDQNIDNGVVLTAALTGPIATKEQHPDLPTTPAEIAAAARAAWEAGAAVAHVHIRDEAGLPTADLDRARETLEAISEACPILIQLSTGVGLNVPLEARSQLVELSPSMATLNVATMTFGAGEFRNPPDGVRKLAARMRELNVKPELELYDVGHIELALRLLAEDLLVEPLQFSFVMGVRGGMPADVELLPLLLRRLPPDSVWQMIAIGRANLAVTATAIAQGGNARTGLEDTLYIEQGRLADNGSLVARLHGVATSLGRPVLTPAQAAERFNLARQ